MGRPKSQKVEQCLNGLFLVVDDDDDDDDDDNYITAVLEYLDNFLKSQLLYSILGSTTIESNMEEIDIYLKQTVLSGFLVADDQQVTCIHEHLLKVRGRLSMSLGVFSDGKTD
jgi:hypothetical protein